MGHYDPQLARQLAAIDRLPFSRELRNRMRQRAIAIWRRDNADDPEEFGIEDYPWRRDVQPEQAAA